MTGPPNLSWLSRFQPGAEHILMRAHELVAYGWCQGADARDQRDGPVPPWSEEARSWSLLGALVAAVDLPAEPGAVTGGADGSSPEGFWVAYWIDGSAAPSADCLS